MRAYWARDEKTRFLVIGGVNTAIGYLLFTGVYLLIGRLVHYMVVALLSHAMAVCVAYYLQRRFVFRSGAAWLPEFVRYNLSLAGVLGAGLAGLYFLVDALGLHPLLAQAVVTGISIVVSYMAHRHYSFRRA